MEKINHPIEKINISVYFDFVFENQKILKTNFQNFIFKLEFFKYKLN